MFVITADQIDSTHRADAVADTLDRLNRDHGTTLPLAADRNAGDELQVLASRASTALAVITELAREEQWSIGVGIGPVEHPLPRSTREARGPAFIAARTAVGDAKSSSTRFALRVAEPGALASEEVAPLVDLLLMTRARWSVEGWELYDLLETGMTQARAAARLGITAQAVSQRARAAGLRADAAARHALESLLDRADGGPRDT